MNPIKHLLIRAQPVRIRCVDKKFFKHYQLFIGSERFILGSDFVFGDEANDLGAWMLENIGKGSNRTLAIRYGTNALDRDDTSENPGGTVKVMTFIQSLAKEIAGLANNFFGSNPGGPEAPDFIIERTGTGLYTRYHARVNEITTLTLEDKAYLLKSLYPLDKVFAPHPTAEVVAFLEQSSGTKAPKWGKDKELQDKLDAANQLGMRSNSFVTAPAAVQEYVERLQNTVNRDTLQFYANKVRAGKADVKEVYLEPQLLGFSVTAVQKSNRSVCPDCKGKKKIVLLTSIVKCELCSGQGMV